MRRCKADFLRGPCNTVHKPGEKVYKNYSDDEDDDDNDDDDGNDNDDGNYEDDDDDDKVHLSGFILGTLATLTRLQPISQADGSSTLTLDNII